MEEMLDGLEEQERVFHEKRSDEEKARAIAAARAAAAAERDAHDELDNTWGDDVAYDDSDDEGNNDLNDEGDDGVNEEGNNNEDYDLFVPPGSPPPPTGMGEGQQPREFSVSNPPR